MILGRRAFLAGALAALAAACSRGGPRDGRVSLEDHVPGEPLHVPGARAYVVDVPPERADELLDRHPEPLHDGIRLGVLALSQECPVDGCRLSWCRSSGWFECGCDAAAFARTGEWRDGPGERGMSLYRVEVGEDAELVVDTSQTFDGPARVAADQQVRPDGPRCVGSV